MAGRALTSCAAIIAVLACAAAVASGASTTGGVSAPGPDLAPGGVAAPDPAPAKSPAPKHKTVDRAAPSATTPAVHTARTPSQTNTVGATAAVPKHTAVVRRSSHRPAKRSRHPGRRHQAVARAPHAIFSARILSPLGAHLITKAAESRGPDGRLVRAAVALLLVALAGGSLTLRLSTQLPRAARWR